MPDPSQLSSSTAATRRAVLRLAGLAALSSGGAAVLGACSPDTDSTAPGTSPPVGSPTATSATRVTSPPTSSEPPTKAAPTPSATTRKTARPPSGPSVATSEVPVGGGVIMQDANYVITQPSAGKFKAFSKTCTHQGCPLASVKGGTINCKCHGSKFSIENGSVVDPPANSPLPEARVTVSRGRVVVDE